MPDAPPESHLERDPHARLKTENRWGIFWNILNQGGRTIIGLILTVILTRLLDPRDYGLLALTTVAVGFSAIFIDFGFKKALIQADEVSDTDYSTIFWFNLLIGTVCTLIIFLLAPFIANYYEEPLLTNLIRCVSVNCILVSLTLVQIARYTRDMNFALQTKVSLIGMVGGGAVGVAMAYTGFGVWSLVAQLLVTQLLQVVLYFYLLRWFPARTFSRDSIRRYQKFGASIFGLGVLSTIAAELDYLVIGRIAPISELGFYQKGRSLNRLPSSLSSSVILTALFPTLSKLKNDEPAFRRMFRDTDEVIALVIVPVFALLYVVSEPLITVLFSTRWLESADYFRLLCISGFLYPLSALRVNTVVAKGKPQWLFWESLVLNPVKIGSLILLGYFYGIIGIIGAVILVQYLDFFTLVYFCKKLNSGTISEQFKNLLPGLAIGVAAALGAYGFLRFSGTGVWLQLIGSISAFGVLYLLLNHLFRPAAYQRLLVLVSNRLNK